MSQVLSVNPKHGALVRASNDSELLFAWVREYRNELVKDNPDRLRLKVMGEKIKRMALALSQSSSQLL